MGKKLTIEQAKEAIEKLGSELLSDIWVGSREDYQFKCGCGNTFARKYYQVHDRKRIFCKECQDINIIKNKENKINKYKIISLENNVELLANKWLGATENYDFKCECGNTFNRKYSSVISLKLNRCRECVLKEDRYNAITLIKARETIKKLNCELICEAEDWNGTQEKYDFKCSCGNIFNRIYSGVQQGKISCLECSENDWILNHPTRLNYDDVRKFVEIESQSGCKIKSTSYINNSTPMLFICSCGEEFTTTYASFKNANCRKCKKCSIENLKDKLRLDYNYVKQYIESYNCKLISKEYINSHEYLQISCLICGNKFQSTFGNFQSTTHKCPECAIKATQLQQSFTKEFVENYLHQEGYELLSGYINCDTDLKLKCPEGHIFYMDFYHFKNRGQRCKVCFKLSGRCGENSGTWKGGITKLQHSMREFIKDWVKESLKQSDYKCQITGKNGKLNVHHTYQFRNILEETLLELDLELKSDIGDYSQDELIKMKELIRQKHIDYDCSFVMLETIHKLFHKTYGFKNTTREDIDNFKIRYLNGEFNL